MRIEEPRAGERAPQWELLKHASFPFAPPLRQEILACVVLKPGVQCTEADLIAHCNVHLGRYKTPRLLRVVATLPKGPSGKVQRLKLLDVA